MTQDAYLALLLLMGIGISMGLHWYADRLIEKLPKRSQAS